MKRFFLSLAIMTISFTTAQAQQTKADILNRLNILISHASGQQFSNWGNSAIIRNQQISADKVVVELQDRTSSYTAIPWNQIGEISVKKAAANNELAKIEFEFSGDNTVAYQNLYAGNNTSKTTQHKGMHLYFLEKDREEVNTYLNLLKEYKN